MTSGAVFADPQALRGVVTSFEGGVLLVRTDSGREFSATVDDATCITAPPQEAIAIGRVFNPQPPPPPVIDGRLPRPPALPPLADQYPAPVSMLHPARRIAGAVFTQSPNGTVRWLAIAVESNSWYSSDS